MRSTPFCARFWRPFAAVLAAALLLAACSDSAVNVRSRFQLALAPQLAPGMPNAALGQVGSVHVVLLRGSTAIVDTTAALNGADSVALVLTVNLLGQEEHLTAHVELLSGSTVFFAGSQDVDARAGGSATSGIPVQLRYVGPGAGTAKISIAPRDTTAAATAAWDFRVSAADSAGAATSVPVQWSVSDATLAAISGTGHLTANGRRGVVVVRASTPTGVQDSTHVTLLPVPTRLALITGDAQSSGAGTTLSAPFTVEIDASDGPVANVPVHFSAPAGASVLPADVATDASGRASARITLANASGRQSFSASAAGLQPVSITATATAAPAALAVVSGNAQSDTVGRALAQPFVVHASDQFGAPAPGARVSWTRLSGNGMVGADSSTTDGQGNAQITYTLGSHPGTDSIRAALAGTSAQVLFTATALRGGPSTMQLLAGGGQSSAAGGPLATALTVKVVDTKGNGVPGVVVSFNALTTGASVNPASASTDTGGVVSSTMILGTSVGAYSYKASLGVLSVTVTEVAVAGPAAMLGYVSGSGQTGFVGDTLKQPLVVAAHDAYGNAVTGAQVTWVRTYPPNGPSFTAYTDSSGQSQIGYILSPVPETDTIAAVLTGTGSKVIFTETAVAKATARLAPPGMVSGRLVATRETIDKKKSVVGRR